MSESTYWRAILIKNLTADNIDQFQILQNCNIMMV